MNKVGLGAVCPVRKLCLRKTLRGLLACISLLAMTGGICVWYAFQSSACSRELTAAGYDQRLLDKVCRHNIFNESDLNKQHKLDLDGKDVIIFLHIQKTGGATFSNHLAYNLDVDFPCQCQPDLKKCQCVTKSNKHWLFSRQATGWACGLHADWTELTDCVDLWFKHNDVKSRKHRRYHYITLLRSPDTRFISEWRHVRRGATWKNARLQCNRRPASLQEVPYCYTGSNWSGVTLEEFLSCRHNLAFNRMTRMLADLTLVNCYNQSGLTPEQRQDILLGSAKENLLGCSFFGLVEEQVKTQFLFENTFGVRFTKVFRQRDKTHADNANITFTEMRKIRDKNKSDIELFHFAKDLFLQRVANMERKVGFTVSEYFSRIREADENTSAQAGKKVTEQKYEDEYDNTDDNEDVVDFMNYYSVKLAGVDENVDKQQIAI